MPVAQDSVGTLNARAPQSPHVDVDKPVRLHITPFNPALLKVYLAPSVLPLAKNISYHAVATFPEKGFGYVELPAMEAQKLKKKLNGSTLKGSKVKISEAKSEKRKVEDADDVEPPKKRKKAKKEQGVLEGVELPDDRKVKRGWTEPPVKNKKEKKSKEKDKDKKSKRKESKYTKEPELLFKAKLTPVAAAEEARKEKSKDKKKEKKEKKAKNKAKREVIVHEFEKNTKQPSFLKAARPSTVNKEAVEYIDGTGWVDEDGNVVEPEIGKVRNRRVLELVDIAPVQPTTEKPSTTPSPKSSPAPKATKDKTKQKSKKITPPPSSESEEDESEEESSVVSSSEDESSASEHETDPKTSAPTSQSARAKSTPEISASSPLSSKEVHPLEALFKRPKPLTLSTPNSKEVSTPAKGLAPINTTFSFFDNDTDPMDAAAAHDGAPITPYTQRDLEWRGLRSAAPTPDTAAIGRRFSFPWRNSSQETDDADGEGDAEADTQLANNTKANAAGNHLPGVAEEDEEGSEAETGAGADEGRAGDDSDDGAEEENKKPESEFEKSFWENQGSTNRAWKKRRRTTVKSKRLSENRKAGGGRMAR